MLDIRDSPHRGRVVRIPIRYIKTKGLVIKVDKSVLKPIIKSLGHSESEGLWRALHTMSHSFLVRLPQITGLEGTDFGEALSAKRLEFAVFDNSLGGLGGVEGVIEGNKLSQNYEWSVREAYKCPLACIRACKACLYTDSCYMLNWRLDKRILEHLGW